MGTDLVRATPIMRHVKAGEVSSDLSVEQFATEKERWKEGGTARDLAVVTALDALEQGRQLVDLNTVMNRGGFSSNSGQGSQLPALTLAPPYATEVSMRLWHDGEMRLRAKTNSRIFSRTWEKKMSTEFRFPRSTAISYSAVATVPLMPPEIRAVANKDHLILWESEWRKVGSQVQRPPMDPALLEHVSGSLWVVLAAWDLSPLEVAALS